MKKYSSGKSPEGHHTFSIPLQKDAEGLIGRECPTPDCSPKYFKIEPRETENESEFKESNEILFCPYCGHKYSFQKFVTRDQIDWVKSMISRDVVRSIDDAFRRALSVGTSGTYRSGGFLRLNLEYHSGSLPSVRHYAEKDLKRIVVCDQCGERYAVYGISMYCPWCGKGNIRVHFRRSSDIIRTLMRNENQIKSDHGKEVAYQLLGNCIEDSVSLYEGFLKEIYIRKLIKIISSEQYDEKVRRIKNNFQNLAKSEEIIRDDLGYELFSPLSTEEREFLEIQFAKRHVITHNLGLIDLKYLERVQSWQISGEDVPLSNDEIEKTLNLIKKIIEAISE